MRNQAGEKSKLERSGRRSRTERERERAHEKSKPVSIPMHNTPLTRCPCVLACNVRVSRATHRRGRARIEVFFLFFHPHGHEALKLLEWRKTAAKATIGPWLGGEQGIHCEELRMSECRNNSSLRAQWRLPDGIILYWCPTHPSNPNSGGLMPLTVLA